MSPDLAARHEGRTIDVDGVVWEDGHAKPAGSNVGDFTPLSLKEIAGKAALTGGPLTAAASVNAATTVIVKRCGYTNAQYGGRDAKK